MANTHYTAVRGDRSIVKKYTVTVQGRKTSIALEGAFWENLREIASLQLTTVTNLVREIDAKRENANLSSAIRVFVFNYYRNGGSRLPAAARRDERYPSLLMEIPGA